MYIIKIKGTARIPDYVQIRDEAYSLIAYFRADRPEKALSKCGLDEHSERILRLINEMPFGQMQKLNLP